MTAMERSGTKRLMLKEKEFELVLEREDQIRPISYVSQPSSDNEFVEGSDNRNRATQALSRGAEMPTTRVAAKDEEADLSQVFITSPMVGTFYMSPSPDDPSFVKVGDKVEKDTVVCVIEAMKVMNEVKAGGVSGIVVEVLVENAHPVEFGTKLYRIK